MKSFSKVKTRESNIELLRIVSMFFIIIYHFLINSKISHTISDPTITKPLTAVFHVGVVCFILISGYWKIKFSVSGFIKLFIQTSFYSLFIYVSFSCLNPDKFGFTDLIRSLLPFHWWFIKVYFALYFLSEIFNQILNDISKEKKILLLTSLGFVSFGIAQITPSLFDGKNPINFIFIYCLGDFIRYHITVSPKKVLMVYLILNILIYTTIHFTFTNAVLKNILFDRLLFPYNSAGLILNASLLFLCFKPLRFSSKIINWFSASILPVYLLHENKYLGRYLYDYVNHLSVNLDSKILLSLSLVILALLVIVVCVLTDKLLKIVYTKIASLIVETTFIKKIDLKISGIIQN